MMFMGLDVVLVQGRDACRKLEKKLATDLAQFPDNKYLEVMLKRTKSNLREWLSFTCVGVAVFT
jgi:hypothetical protein